MSDSCHQVVGCPSSKCHICSCLLFRIKALVCYSLRIMYCYTSGFGSNGRCTYLTSDPSSAQRNPKDPCGIDMEITDPVTVTY